MLFVFLKGLSEQMPDEFHLVSVFIDFLFIAREVHFIFLISHGYSFISSIQRKNGKIIIRAMLELEKVMVESIVGKICKDYNVTVNINLFLLLLYKAFHFSLSDLLRKGFS